MTQEAGTPAGFWDRVEQVAKKVANDVTRAGLLNSSSISSGGLTIKRGGSLVLMNNAGTGEQFFIGPVIPNMPDGTGQPGVILRREDGSLAMAMYDPDPTGTFRQYLALYDRLGNIIMSDDTDSGQGLARPYVGGGFAASNFADFRFSTTSTSFVTLADQYVTKQQPRLSVYVRSSMDTSGSTGEVRVLVDGVQLGATASQAFAIVRNTFLGAIAGTHMTEVHVEIQARVVSGAGSLRVEPISWRGVQS